jgi:hypothetical protein
MKTCPTCGQALPPDPSPAHLLSPTQAKIYDIVARAGSHGINSDVLFERLYADDEEGGPLSGKQSMYVMVREVNLTFKRYSVPYRIRTPGAGNGSTANYRLERL